MRKKESDKIYSGASLKQVREDLKQLVNFQEKGMSIEAISQLFEEKLIPHLMKYDNSGFLSMFNTTLEEGAKLGADLALEYNQGVTDWYVSPGGAVLEEMCIEELCKLFGLGPEADGTFMYSGTYANQEALYLALHKKAELEGFDFAQKGIKGFENPEKLLVLISQDAHFSLKHAVRMLGLGEDNLRTLQVDENRKIDIEQMQQQVEDLQSSNDIFCIVATTGTTSTGSIDPVSPMRKICDKTNSWLHVDGAYGLAYSLIPKYKSRFSGIELADSITWDPHKQFAVPIPNSILFVRSKEDFNRMALHSDYLYRKGEDTPSPGLKSPPSTRPFSALPVISSILYLGLEKMIERLSSPLDAIAELYQRLQDNSEIELCNKPETGILCFRMKKENMNQSQLNNFQQRIYDEVNKEGEYSISLSKLDERSVLRLVAIAPTSVETLMKSIEYVKDIAKQIIDQGV